MNTPVSAWAHDMAGKGLSLFFHGWIVLVIYCWVVCYICMLIICMLTLLLIPLAGLHFCVGLDLVTPSLYPFY